MNYITIISCFIYSTILFFNVLRKGMCIAESLRCNHDELEVREDFKKGMNTVRKNEKCLLKITNNFSNLLFSFLIVCSSEKLGFAKSYL